MNEGTKQVILMLLMIKLNSIFVYLCADSTLQQPTETTKRTFK